MIVYIYIYSMYTELASTPSLAQVEYVALQVLQLLKASERVRNSLLYDSNAEEDQSSNG